MSAARADAKLGPGDRFTALAPAPTTTQANKWEGGAAAVTLTGVLIAGAVAGFILGFTGAGGTIVGIPFYLYLAGFAPHATFGTNALGVAAIGVVLLIVRGFRKELRYGPGVLFAVPGLVGIAAGTQASMFVSGASLVFLLGFVVLLVAGYIFYLSTYTPPEAASTSAGTSQRERALAAVEADYAEHGVAPSDPTLGASSRVAAGDAADPTVVAEAGRTTRSTALQGAGLARILPLGLVVGCVAGFFGIGGGFMIVPGTAWAAKIDLKAAAAASLIPITAFAAFVGVRYTAAGSASLSMAGVMTLIGIVFGAFGVWLSTKVPTKRFQQVFAGFLVLLGMYMILFQ